LAIIRVPKTAEKGHRQMIILRADSFARILAGKLKRQAFEVQK